jgi:hypothetical protein
MDIPKNPKIWQNNLGKHTIWIYFREIKLQEKNKTERETERKKLDGLPKGEEENQSR